jgi:putative spermidine/putrescine transport system permease protein
MSAAGIASAGAALLRRDVGRSGRRHALLMAALMLPSVVFVAACFLLPLALFLFRGIDNSEIPLHLPRTVAAIGNWDGSGLPPEAVPAAMVEDLRPLAGTPQLAQLGRRLNYALPGFRGLLTRTARRLPPAGSPDMAAALARIDAKWAEPATWAVIRQQSGRLTDFYLLTALDLERQADGSIARVHPEQAIFLSLYGRTLVTSLGVTLICLLIGFPVAAVMAAASPATANLLQMLVLVPFWTSLLVRTTAWVILLQNNGLVNKALMALGLTDAPLALIYNRGGVFIAMVHVLLPYMVLPLYAVLRGIAPSHLRAAASLGANPFRVFRTVYLPLSLPGVAAGCTLVFVLSVGFYVTPALVGGPGDQMIGYFIAYFTNSAVNWGQASALGALLLLMVAAIYLVVGRMIGLERLKVR